MGESSKKKKKLKNLGPSDSNNNIFGKMEESLEYG